MKKFIFFSSLVFFLWSLSFSLRAQTGASSAPTREMPPSPALTTGGSDNGSQAGDEEEPFKPHWSGQVGLTYSTLPTSQGQGQIQKELNFTGTYNLTEGGDYFSLGITGGQQKVEGVDTNYGELILEGGLVMGIFLPTLSYQGQQGASALNSNTVDLNLNFKIFDPLEIGPLMDVGLQSHQGALSQLGLTSDAIDEIDSGNLTLGAMVTFIPWEDFLTLTLTGQQEFDDTYKYENVTHTVSHPVNQRDRIPSLTLGEDATFWKDFELELAEQAGREYYPAGTVYSPILGRTVTNAKAATQSFEGFSVALMYNFQ
jgi:hypothetical protein